MQINKNTQIYSRERILQNKWGRNLILLVSQEKNPAIVNNFSSFKTKSRIHTKMSIKKPFCKISQNEIDMLQMQNLKKVKALAFGSEWGDNLIV